MLPVADWTPEYVRDVVATAPESECLEKKAAEKFPDREEMAKQICAFANAGLGSLVYGMPKAGGLDVGVSPTVGTQTVEDWVAGQLAKWHQPPITDVVIRRIEVPGHHSPGFSIVAIETPLSERRPHWSLLGNRQTAYLRVGATSAPMGYQTFLDISSRGSVPVCEILKPYLRLNGDAWELEMQVQLVSGPACDQWCAELILDPRRWQTGPHGENGEVLPSGALAFKGIEPLFPNRPTHISQRNTIIFRSRVGEGINPGEQLTISLFASSSQPVTKSWIMRDLLIRLSD